MAMAIWQWQSVYGNDNGYMAMAMGIWQWQQLYGNVKLLPGEEERKAAQALQEELARS